MRWSLLDIEPAPDSRAQAPTTVIRMQIQPRNRFQRGQQHRQLQLCVPLVITDGRSYRMKDAQHRKENPPPT
jgi:hypothetical protein